MGIVFANCPGNLGPIPGHVIPNTFKRVPDNSLLNTQQYKVRIKGKVKQLRRSAHPIHLSIEAIEKGSVLVANFTFYFIQSFLNVIATNPHPHPHPHTHTYIYIYIYIYHNCWILGEYSIHNANGTGGNYFWTTIYIYIVV